MPEIICNHCGMTTSHHIEIENNNHSAYCDICGNFTKNVPHSTKKATYYFGRYRGIDVSQIQDKQYLEFSLDLPMISDKLRGAIESQILNLSENG